MLGRFVLPLTRLVEWEKAAAPALDTVGDDEPWRLSVLGDAHQSAPISRRIRDFNSRFLGRAYIDSVELKASGPDEVAYAGTLGEDGVSAYVEVPIVQDPLPWIEALVRAGARAKVRTGGVTKDGFPATSDLLRFLQSCKGARVPFKATAGLHHPLRAEYRLTYEADSPTDTMFGFLNLFLAAAFLADGMDESKAAQVLEEKSPVAFEFDDRGASWRSHRVGRDALARARKDLIISFGSCSFTEPIEELQALNLLQPSIQQA